MKLEELESKICQAIDEAISNGYEIISDTWYASRDKKKYCCAIGAISIQKQDPPPIGYENHFKESKDLFNNDDDAYWCFIAGFQTLKEQVMSPTRKNYRYYELGAKIRSKYNPGNYFKPQL